jgi:hypothetical protein
MDHEQELYNILKVADETSTGDDETRTVPGEESSYGEPAHVLPPADQVSPGVIAAHKDTRQGVLSRSFSELERSAIADKQLIGQNFETREFGSHSPLLQKSSSFNSIKDQVFKLFGRK